MQPGTAEGTGSRVRTIVKVWTYLPEGDDSLGIQINFHFNRVGLGRLCQNDLQQRDGFPEAGDK